MTTVLRSLLGPHSISITHHELVTTRPNPLDESAQPRRLMLSLYQPQSSTSLLTLTPWMPQVTADHWNESMSTADVPEHTLRQVRLEYCVDPSHALPLKDAPLLLFSHGSGSSRLQYGALLSAVASSGYTVLSVDHTYDSEIVEFPNGDVVYNKQPGQGDWSFERRVDYVIDNDLPVRVADLHSALAAVEEGSIPGIPSVQGLKVGVFGHSLGGETATVALRDDKRSLGAVAYDAPFWGRIADRPMEKPLLMIGQKDRDPIHARLDETWDKMWNCLKGWKAEIRIDGSKHLSFSDLPQVLAAAGVDVSKESMKKEYGIIDPKSLQETTWKLTVSFFDMVMKGKMDMSNILEKVCSDYSEVVVRRQSGSAPQ